MPSCSTSTVHHFGAQRKDFFYTIKILYLPPRARIFEEFHNAKVSNGKIANIPRQYLNSKLGIGLVLSWDDLELFLTSFFPYYSFSIKDTLGSSPIQSLYGLYTKLKTGRPPLLLMKQHSILRERKRKGRRLRLLTTKYQPVYESLCIAAETKWGLVPLASIMDLTNTMGKVFMGREPCHPVNQALWCEYRTARHGAEVYSNPSVARADKVYGGLNQLLSATGPFAVLEFKNVSVINGDQLKAGIMRNDRSFNINMENNPTTTFLVIKNSHTLQKQALYHSQAYNTQLVAFLVTRTLILLAHVRILR
jgi:hypothetical protein